MFVKRCAAFTLLHLLALCASTTHADAEPSKARRDVGAATETYRIDAIVIEGLFFTKPHVVTRELLFGEGEATTIAEIEESVQRLRNLGIFRVAEYALLDRRVPLPDGTVPHAEQEHRVLLITVDERWTLIPFGTFSAGGGTFSLTTGLYDINFLGNYIALGGSYRRKGDTNSFALWASDPRLFGERLSLSGSVAQSNDINFFFDDAGEVSGGHLRFRRSASLRIDREWVRWFATGLGLRLASDRYSTRLLSDEVAEMERQRGLPEPVDYLAARVSARVGRMDSDSYLRRGVVLVQAVEASREGLASNLSFVDTVTSLIVFAQLPFRTNLGFRSGLGTTNVDRVEYLHYLGGLNVIRGFFHRRFGGSHYWFSNAELRVPSLDSRWLVLQHVAFVDAAGLAGSLQELRRIDGMSTGVGLRILSPKIFSFVARFDYAWSLVGDGRSAFSFGAGQFF